MFRRSGRRWRRLPIVGLVAATMSVTACGETSPPPDASQPPGVDDPSGDTPGDPDPDDAEDPSPDELPEDVAGDRSEQEADEVSDEPADDPATDAALEPRVEEAVAELVADGVDRDAIELVTAERVTWPDGSLGCPQPGMAYTQVLVEGYRIVLAAEGDEIAFHGAGNEPPRRCDTPAPPFTDGGSTS
jgi:hypothetical protein